MGDQDRDTIVVRTESHETEARIVVGFLQSWGIEATILEDDAGDQLPSMEGTHGVKVIVAGEDAERARSLLAERDDAEIETSSDEGDEDSNGD